MNQSIHFCTTADGAHIAYATVGRGPAFVIPPGWISHLELEWEQPAVRSFCQHLARHHTVVRYDKLGCGLSDRGRPAYSLEAEVRVLEAVVDHLKLRPFTLFTFSQAGPVAVAYAVKHPRRVSHLILYGTWARRDPLENDRLRAALIPLIQAHWGIGSKALADAFLPGVDASVREWFARLQREAASKEVAADLVEFARRLDVADRVAKLRVPTLVVHRRGDLMVPFRLGRELAALIPKARFVPLEGQIHRPYFGDSASVLRVIAEFLGDPVEPEASITHVDVEGRPGDLGASTSSRALKTALFIDIVGSTERATELGDRRWTDVLQQYYEIARREIEGYRGRYVDAAGDGLFAVFDSPAQTIRCACAVRKSVSSLGIEVRAGVHTGECEMVGPQVRGIAVHIGARVAALAGAGEVLVSGTVKDLVAGSGLQFEDRGARALKGIPGECRIFVVRT